jgi:hypothetical protein
VTARLIVRRVKDGRFPDALFPVWRYHPFLTDTDEHAAAADITHRRHAIIETVFAKLIPADPWPTCPPDASGIVNIPARGPHWLRYGTTRLDTHSHDPGGPTGKAGQTSRSLLPTT